MKLFLSSAPKVHSWTSQEKLDILTDPHYGNNKAWTMSMSMKENL